MMIKVFNHILDFLIILTIWIAISLFIFNFRNPEMTQMQCLLNIHKAMTFQKMDKQQESQEMISNEELMKMRTKLSLEEIDDSEEILDWFAENGVELIDELLKRRRS